MCQNRPPKSVIKYQLSSVQSLNYVQLFVIQWTVASQTTLSKANSQGLLKLMSAESVMPSNHLVLCHPLSSCLQPFSASRSFPMSHFFASGGQSIRFHFSFSPFNGYSRMIFFRIDWFDHLAMQETLKCLLQHHGSKASVLPCSAFFTVQLSQPYMSTGKIIVLTRWTFIGKVCVCFLILCLGCP